MKRFTKITLDYRLYLKKSQHTNGTFMKVQGAGCKAHEGGPFLRRHRGVEGNQASQVGGTQTQTAGLIGKKIGTQNMAGYTVDDSEFGHA
jgi:hypothetical protein